MIRVSDLTVKCGLDWGSSKPGCVLWGVALPDAHAHIFDEFKFGGKQKLTVKECADAIREKTLGDWKMPQMPRIYCDPALKIKTGQIGEDFIQTFGRYRVTLTPVSNNRIVGWQRVHEALKTDAQTRTPWLTVHPRCKYLIRTIPAMVQDEDELEDLDTESDDHACFIGETRILTESGERRLDTLAVGERVWTRQGLQRIEAVAQTAVTHSVWDVLTSEGRVLRGTGNHPIFVEGRGFVPLRTLVSGDRLSRCPAFPDITFRPNVSGGNWWDRFRMAIISTIEMATRAITRSVIWNAFQPMSISAGIGSSGQAFRSPARFAESPLWTAHNSNPANSARTTVNRHGDGSNARTTNFAPAWSADVSLPATATSRLDAVHGPAVSVVAVCPLTLPTSVPIYNMTVEHAHEYYADGILVSNCDALRYLLMGGLKVGMKASPQEKPFPPNSWGWWRKKHEGLSATEGVLR